MHSGAHFTGSDDEQGETIKRFLAINLLVVPTVWQWINEMSFIDLIGQTHRTSYDMFGIGSLRFHSTSFNGYQKFSLVFLGDLLCLFNAVFYAVISPLVCLVFSWSWHERPDLKRRKMETGALVVCVCLTRSFLITVWFAACRSLPSIVSNSLNCFAALFLLYLIFTNTLTQYSEFVHWIAQEKTAKLYHFAFHLSTVSDVLRAHLSVCCFDAVSYYAAND